MGALGVSQGKRFRLHAPTIGFARHHSMEIKACQAGDAKRKGKCERPFRDLKESFLTELDALGAPGSMVELNQRAGLWLPERVHSRRHSTTGVAPAARLETERRFLSALPRRRFDTAYVDSRRVHPRLPLVEWDGVPYSVPPGWVGHVVCCRVEVDSDTLEITAGATVVSRHRVQPGATEAVWDPAHRAAAEAIALGRARPKLHVVSAPASDRHSEAGHLDLGQGDYDVESLDLQARYGGCGCTGQGA
jgi:hypothetical protein